MEPIHNYFFQNIANHTFLLNAAGLCFIQHAGADRNARMCWDSTLVNIKQKQRFRTQTFWLMSIQIHSFWSLNCHLSVLSLIIFLSACLSFSSLRFCLSLLLCLPLQAKQLWGLTPGSTPCPCPHLPPPRLRRCPPPRLLSPATGRVLLPSVPPRGSWAGTRGTATWTTTSTWQRWAGCLPHSCKCTCCSFLSPNFLRRWSQFHQIIGLNREEHTVCTQLAVFNIKNIHFGLCAPVFLLAICLRVPTFSGCTSGLFWEVSFRTTGCHASTPRIATAL